MVSGASISGLKVSRSPALEDAHRASKKPAVEARSPELSKAAH